MKSTKLALIAAVTAAAVIAYPAIAHADFTSYEFQSPSGNIGCEMMSRDGTASAVCKIHDHTWAAPPPDGNCHSPGQNLILGQGAAACVGVYPSQIWLLQDENTLATLAYAQTHTVGMMTCDSEPSGMTCTDSSTGHFFRISRESYQLG